MAVLTQMLGGLSGLISHCSDLRLIPNSFLAPCSLLPLGSGWLLPLLPVAIEEKSKNHGNPKFVFRDPVPF